MRKRIESTSKALLVSLSFLLFASFAQASTYFVSNVTTSDANPELAASLKSLIVTAVGNAGGQAVDQQGQANFVLRADLVKLGAAYVLTVTRVSPNGSQYSARQKAANVESLDDAADRAVRGAILAKQTKQDVRVGDVQPQEEEKMRRRIKSKSFTYLGFGPGGFSSLGDSRMAYDLAIARYWEVTPNSAIKIMGNYVTSGDLKTYFLMGALGLDYNLTDEDSSPYIGGALGFGTSGSLISQATTIGGLAATLGVGYRFFRTSSTQFDVFVGYSNIFGNNTIGAPGVFSLRVGILF